MINSRVSNIEVPLKDYKRSQVSGNKFPYFVGRKKIIEKLKDLFSTVNENGGSYLMVGARGMGKTTVINKVIEELKNEENNWLYRHAPITISILWNTWKKVFKGEKGPIAYERIEISLSNENFDDIDFYRIIGKKLFRRFLQFSKTHFALSLFRIAFISGVFTSLGYWIYSCYSYILGHFWLPGIVFFGTILAGSVFWLTRLFFGGQKIKLRNKARYLLRRIEADVSREASVSLTGKIAAGLPDSLLQGGLSGKQVEKYPIADIRFIEHELIEFIKAFNNTFRYTRFIVVFDELDKIEPGGGEGENLNYDIETEAEEVESRKKQKAVFEILGNFKYFLKNAEAKFIFIAGREMTDASMADISKRNFYLRSIFDEIIHISSLLKEDIKYMDLRVTSAVELYVFGIILGETKFLEGDDSQMTRRKKIWKVEAGAQEDQQLLEDQVINRIFKIKYGTDQPENRHIEENRYREFLQDFILYITYRSHGAPKLLTQYIERYIQKRGASFQLVFNFNDLVVIGFVSNLYRQLVKNTYNTTIGNSDKLLSTLPFLFDHFLKFHDFAFSWRSLELLPDVVDVNKSPNLRRHIKNIVDYLKIHQVNEISGGLFQYKFTKVAVNEIRYIGSISRTSRAAFNFTLDESYPLKKAFGKRIQRLTQANRNANTHRDMVHSIEFYYTVLGDLHFYDKEYDQAIENYNNAVQPFRSKNVHLNEKGERIRSHEFIMYIRGMLKLVLTYERIKDYHLIFTYLERVNRNSFDFFHFNDEKIELLGIQSENKGETSKAAKESNVTSRKIFELEDYIKSTDLQFNNQWVFVDGLLNVLYILEKASPQGVTTSDIEYSMFRFKRILGIIEQSEYQRRKSDEHRSYKNRNGMKQGPWWSSMLKAHVTNHIGDLLFFKNGYLPGTMAAGHKKEDGDAAEYFYNYILKKHIQVSDPELSEIPKYLNLPFSAYEYYRDSLSNMLIESQSTQDPDNWPDTPIKVEMTLLRRFYQFANAEKKLFRHNYQSKLFYLVGGYIADFGDLLLCFAVRRNADNRPILLFLKEIPDEAESSSEIHLDKIIMQTLVIMYFYKNPAFRFTLFTFLSGYFFKRINRSKEYCYSLIKIIYLLKYNSLIRKANDETDGYLDETDLQGVYVKLFLPAFREFSRGIDELVDLSRERNLHEFLKSKDLPKALAEPKIKELVIAMNELILASHTEENPISFCELLIGCANWINPFTTVNNSWIRTLELRYKVSLNEYEKSIPSEFADTQTHEEERLLLDIDSLWCLKKIITNLEVYGISYTTNHFFAAEAHHKIANILTALEPTGPKYRPSDDSIESEAVMDEEWLMKKDRIWDEIKESLYDKYGISMSTKKLDQFLNPMVHYRYARDNYIMTIKLHSQGSCYYDVIESMYYLEGDFDDQYNHFCAAIDRYRINTEWVGKLLSQCRKALNEQVPEEVETAAPPAV